MKPVFSFFLFTRGESLVVTVDGDVVMIKKSGIGWSMGKVFFNSTYSQKLACSNKVDGV
jgi:hypothetical protein